MAVTITTPTQAGSNYVTRGNNATVTFASSSMPVIRKAEFEFSYQHKIVDFSSMEDWTDLNKIVGITNGIFRCVGEVTAAEMFNKIWPLSTSDLTTLNGNCDYQVSGATPLIRVVMSAFNTTNKLDFYGVFASPIVRRGNKSLVELEIAVNYFCKTP